MKHLFPFHYLLLFKIFYLHLQYHEEQRTKYNLYFQAWQRG